MYLMFGFNWRITEKAMYLKFAVNWIQQQWRRHKMPMRHVSS